MIELSISKILLVLTVIAAIIPGSLQQKLRGGREGRGGKRRKPNVETAGSLGEKGQMIKALTINYPLKIFETTNTEDWRAPAKFSKELVVMSDTDKQYREISQAQDQEDVWLYENWFYGMDKGVIMESGALNGILFSNSFMFEQFANWTAIHVGTSTAS